MATTRCPGTFNSSDTWFPVLAVAAAAAEKLSPPVVKAESGSALLLVVLVLVFPPDDSLSMYLMITKGKNLSAV